MQKDNNLNLDDLVLSSGQEFDATKEKIIKQQTLAYDDNQIMPGSNIAMPTAKDVELSKKDADENLIQHAAMLKLQKENEEYQKMSDDEKVKDYICQAQYYRETNDFYHKNGYEMTGKQKRFTKRAIETAWKKGKFKITPEQREDILFELSKASKQQPQVQVSDTQNANKQNVSESIKDLNSLIYRQL